MLTGDAVPSRRALRRGRPTTAVDDEAAVRSMRLVRTGADLVFPGHDRPFRLVAGEPRDYLLPYEDFPAPRG